MRRKPIDAQSEKRILSGMIISDEFLRGIQNILKDNLLRLSYAKIVSKWCIEYYRKYEKAPRETIEAIFKGNVRQSHLEDSDAKLIATFLSELSESNSSTQSFNAPYELDQAEKYLRKRSIEQWKEDVECALLDGDLEKAEATVANYKRPIRNQTKGVDIFTDEEAIRNAFASMDTDIILNLDGRLGQLIGPLCRDDFVVLLGPRGRYKTFFLMWFSLMAALQGQKVLFVSLEMTQKQCMRRLYQMILGESKHPGTFKFPLLDCRQHGSCSRAIENKDGVCLLCRKSNEAFSDGIIVHKEVKRKGMNSFQAIKKGAAISKIIRGGNLKLVCFPSRSISINDLDYYLDNLEYYEGFIPSMIVTDYTDIFKSISTRNETRHSINDNWELQRGLGQKRHALMMTISHTNKETLRRSIREGDSNEDMRKEHHATHNVGLNQTNEEKESGVMRVNITKKREDEYNSKTEVSVLQCLAIGRPILDSF